MISLRAATVRGPISVLPTPGIGANALVTPGSRIPAGSMVLGSPAKVVRALSAEERAGLKHWADKYVTNGAYCLRHGLHVGQPL